MSGDCLTRLMLCSVGTFCYTSRALLCGSFSYAMLCYVGNISYIPHVLYVESLSYRLRTILWGEFLIHAPCCIMWGVSITRLILYYVVSFSYTPHLKKKSCTPHTALCWEFLLHAPCYYYVASLSDTPYIMLYGEFLLHATCYFVWGLSVTRPALFYVGNFSNTRHAILCW